MGIKAATDSVQQAKDLASQRVPAPDKEGDGLPPPQLLVPGGG